MWSNYLFNTCCHKINNELTLENSAFAPFSLIIFRWDGRNIMPRNNYETFRFSEVIWGYDAQDFSNNWRK